MQSPPAPAMDAASALAQAIGRILCAMLDALFGDISALAPRHPIRRAHARTLRHIERYVAALEAALNAPEQAPDETTQLTPEPRPDSVISFPRSALRARAALHPQPADARREPRAPPKNALWPLPPSHAQFVALSH